MEVIMCSDSQVIAEPPSYCGNNLTTTTIKTDQQECHQNQPQQHNHHQHEHGDHLPAHRHPSQQQQKNNQMQQQSDRQHHTVSRKHVELPLEMKRKLIEEREHGVPFTLLGKKYHIATSTAANIWRKKDFFMASRMSGTRKRCNDRTKYKIVNQVTALFVKNMLESNHRIDGEVIKRFARTAAIQCNFHDFHGSNGWLDSFKKRENVRWVRSRQSTSTTNNAAAPSASSIVVGAQTSDNATSTVTSSAIKLAKLQANECAHIRTRRCLSCACRSSMTASSSSSIASLATMPATVSQTTAAPLTMNDPDTMTNSDSNNNGPQSDNGAMDTLQQVSSECTQQVLEQELKSTRSMARRRERDAIIDEWFQGIPLLCQLFDDCQPSVNPAAKITTTTVTPATGGGDSQPPPATLSGSNIIDMNVGNSSLDTGSDNAGVVTASATEAHNHPLDVQLDGQYDDRQLALDSSFEQVAAQLSHHRYRHHRHFHHRYPCRHRHCGNAGGANDSSRCSSRNSLTRDLSNSACVLSDNNNSDNVVKMDPGMSDSDNFSQHHQQQQNVDTQDNTKTAMVSVKVERSDASDNANNSDGSGQNQDNHEVAGGSSWTAHSSGAFETTSHNNNVPSTQDGRSALNQLGDQMQHKQHDRIMSSDDLMPDCYCFKELQSDSDHHSDCHNDDCYVYQEYCDYPDEPELDIHYNVYKYHCMTNESRKFCDGASTAANRDSYYEMQSEAQAMDDASDCYIRNTMSTFADIANQNQQNRASMTDNTDDGNDLFHEINHDAIDIEERSNVDDATPLNDNNYIPNSCNDDETQPGNANNNNSSNNIILSTDVANSLTNQNSNNNVTATVDDGASMASSSYYNYTYSEYGGPHCDLGTVSSATADQSNDELDERLSLMTAATGVTSAHQNAFHSDMLSCEHSHHDLGDFEHEVDIDVDLELDLDLDERHSTNNYCHNSNENTIKNSCMNELDRCQQLWRDNNECVTDNNTDNTLEFCPLLAESNSLGNVDHRNELTSVKNKLIEAVAKLMDYASDRSPNILATLIDLKQQIERESDCSGPNDDGLEFSNVIDCAMYEH